MNTPILLICFNRPDHTRQVLQRILEANPKDLYIFQDGAREGNENDAAKCAEVRQVIDELCEQHKSICNLQSAIFNLHTNFSRVNLGCGRGPMSAITWFFENVEQGIILEDDCIPHPDFFPYCEELLERYKYDNRIALIGGSNYGDIHSDASYSFCCGHMTTWGWASWRRTWKLHDYTLETIDKSLFDKLLHKYNTTWKQREYWWYIWRLVKPDQMKGSCWDYQFYWSFWRYDMVAICPAVNMITNVGVGEDATHGMNPQVTMSRPVGGIMPLTHPQEVKLNKAYDEHLMRVWVNPYDYGWSGFKRLPYLINRWVKRLVGVEGSWLKKE